MTVKQIDKFNNINYHNLLDSLTQPKFYWAYSYFIKHESLCITIKYFDGWKDIYIIYNHFAAFPILCSALTKNLLRQLWFYFPILTFLCITLCFFKECNILRRKLNTLSHKFSVPESEMIKNARRCKTINSLSISFVWTVPLNFHR